MSFEMIAGYSKIKELFTKFCNIITNIDDYKEKGLMVPHGILLHGEPGVGKTVLARAFAANCGEYVELRSADCVGNNSVKNVQDAFEKASKNSPAVLLIDELDKIAEESQDFFMEGNNAVMKVLLQELDKSKHKGNMVVIATCNNYKRLNKALIRSGRFDHIIQIPKPGEADRPEIIKMYLDKIKLKKQLDIDDLAKLTKGLTGAEIESIINISGIMAYETEDKIITMDNIRTAMSRLYTKAVEEDLTKNTKKAHTIAVHEAGHSLLAIMFNDGKHLLGASILPQGDSDGRVVNSYTDDVVSLEDTKNTILVALAGRCAEEIVLGTSYVGSSSDLKTAYDTAVQLVYMQGYCGLRYIMPIRSINPTFKNDESDKKVSELLEDCYNETKQLIEANRDCYDAILQKLEEKFVLSGEEIEQIYKDAISKRS